MSMVCGLDLHRQQITFDAMDMASGEVWRGRVWQPDRDRVRRWLRHDVARKANGQPVALAVEGCTGWRYVVEEITAAGFEAHVAEPADTQAARGRKRHAKTDRSDARLLRELLQGGDLPESWIPPSIVLEWRERVRLYKSLVDQRLVWTQRIHAELFQHGVAVA
jgi:transposase